MTDTVEFEPITFHAAGNPGEDPRVDIDEQLLTVGGSLEARAIDPFENKDAAWGKPEEIDDLLDELLGLPAPAMLAATASASARKKAQAKDDLIVYSREEWGARRPTGGYSRRGTLTHVSIHHGGAVGRPRATKAAAVQTCRDWQRYHQSQGWTDIGYTFLIDGRGRLYEGRPVWALTASVGNWNTGQIAINFMQDGRYYGLTELQRETLRVLFEVGIRRLDVPPLKKIARLPGDRKGVFSHNEYPGHTSNACAGGHIIRHLKWRRGRYT